MLPVFRIIAIFTMVWTVGRGIADEKNRRGKRIVRFRIVAIRCQIVAIRCQAVEAARVRRLPSGDRWLRPG